MWIPTRRKKLEPSLQIIVTKFLHLGVALSLSWCLVGKQHDTHWVLPVCCQKGSGQLKEVVQLLGWNDATCRHVDKEQVAVLFGDPVESSLRQDLVTPWQQLWENGLIPQLMCGYGPSNPILVDEIPHHWPRKLMHALEFLDQLPSLHFSVLCQPI